MFMRLAQSISDTVSMHMHSFFSSADTTLSKMLRPVGSSVDTGSVITHTFLQNHPVDISMRVVDPGTPYWIYYLLFGLIALVAFIRFYYPQALMGLMGFKPVKQASHSNDESDLATGILAPAFLFFNFLVAIALLGNAWFKALFYSEFIEFHLWEKIPVFILVLLGYSLFNLVISWAIGFLFAERALASAHYHIAAQASYLTGLFLSPVLLIYFYNPSPFLLWLGLVILLVFLFLKWYRLLVTGLSQHIYGPVHFFLYLCTVEILPLLLLLKEGAEYLHVE